MASAAGAENVLPAPIISPVRGRYEWNKVDGGGVLVSFENLPANVVLHWRFEWIRTGYDYGCKFAGFTSADERGGDWTSAFRIQPHRMGFVRREDGALPTLELNYPGQYMVQAWLSDNAHQLVSPVTTETYEVVNIDAKRR